MKLRDLWELLKATASQWQKDGASRLAAALSYYMVFSLAPLLVVVIAVAGLVFGQNAAEGQIVNAISGLVGPQAAQSVQGMIASVNDTGKGIVATVIGLATLLIGASGVFGQLQAALNLVWGIRNEGSGVKGMVLHRFLSFTMILGVSFLLLVSLALSAGISALGQLAIGILPEVHLVLHISNIVVSMAIITLLFAAMFKILPDAEIAWTDVWVGAAVTALLFTIGKFLIGLYLGNSGVASTYGAAGSLVLILLWVYYSAQIMLFGAEFTAVYANRFGSRIRPSSHAVLVEGRRAAARGKPVKDQDRVRANEEILAPDDIPTARPDEPDPPSVPEGPSFLTGMIVTASLATIAFVLNTLRREG